MIFRAKTEKNKEKPDGDTKKPAGFRPGAGNRAGVLQVARKPQELCLI